LLAINTLQNGSGYSWLASRTEPRYARHWAGCKLVLSLISQTLPSRAWESMAMMRHGSTP